MKNLSENKRLIEVLSSVAAIIGGLLVGLILMLIINPSQAFQGFSVILIGGFNRGLPSIGTMLYQAVPIILTGLSVAFAFRTGLFNIGATGQLTMGAFVAVFIGVKWGFLGDIWPLLHWIVAVLGGLVAGALFAAIPGILKAYRNVNEVVSSIMLNYVAMFLTIFLIKQTMVFQSQSQDIAATAVTPVWFLDAIFTERSQANIGIFIAILAVIILHIILNKTTFGYELKAVGFNKDASKYAGINEKKSIVLSMMISGAVAGLAGAMMYLVSGKNMSTDALLIPEGFTGIAISLLGLSSPIGVLIAGLFYGSLIQGGYYVQLLQFKPEIIDTIIAVIIYFSALSLFLQKYIFKALKKREKPDLSETEPKGSESK